MPEYLNIYLQLIRLIENLKLECNRVIIVSSLLIALYLRNLHSIDYTKFTPFFLSLNNLELAIVPFLNLKNQLSDIHHLCS